MFLAFGRQTRKIFAHELYIIAIQRKFNGFRRIQVIVKDYQPTD